MKTHSQQKTIKYVDKAALGLIESLGDNCELGFYLRSKNQNTSSLLQWAVCTIESLINHIEKLESVCLFELDNLRPHSRGMVKDLGTGFCFYTAMRSTQTPDGLKFESDLSTRKELYWKEKGKHDHLFELFKLTLLDTENKLFVVKANTDISEDNITRLHSAIALRKKAENFVLLVVFGDKNHILTGPVKWINDTLCYGYISQFAPYNKVLKINLTGWDLIFREITKSKKVQRWLSEHRQETTEIFFHKFKNWDINASHDVKMEWIYDIRNNHSHTYLFLHALTFIQATDSNFAKSIGVDIFNAINNDLSDVTIERMDARYLKLIQIYANYDIESAINFHKRAENIYKNQAEADIRDARLTTSLENTKYLIKHFFNKGLVTLPIRPKFNDSFSKRSLSLAAFKSEAASLFSHKAELLDLQLAVTKERLFTRYSMKDDGNLAHKKWISAVTTAKINNVQFYNLPNAHICHEPTGVGFEEHGKKYYVHAMSDMYHYHRIAGVTAVSKNKNIIPQAYLLPRYGINNYYHSLVDRLPGLYGYKLLDLNCPIYTTYELSETEKYFANLIGINVDTICFDRNAEFQFRRAYLPNISGLRALFFDHIRSQISSNSPKNKKIYISRSNSTNRVLTNEEEIECTLKNMGFEIVNMERYSVKEQISIASTAHTIVAPHGAGLANMIFANSNSNIIELIPDRYMTPLFKQLSIDCGHRYSVVVGKVNIKEKTDQINMNWTVDKNRLVDVLRNE